tara:strand:- start:451 stop:687 length:237 start_codon:yes stop_codon:yes gene_type:complete
MKREDLKKYPICDFEDCGADLAFYGGGIRNIFGEVFCDDCHIDYVEGTFYEDCSLWRKFGWAVAGYCRIFSRFIRGSK